MFRGIVLLLIGFDGQAQASWDYQFRPDGGQLDHITDQAIVPGSPRLSPPQRTNDTIHRVSGITYSSEATPRQGWIYGCGAKRITNAGCRHLDGNTSAVLEGLRTVRNLQ